MKAWTLTFQIRAALEKSGSRLHPAAALTIYETIEAHEEQLRDNLHRKGLEPEPGQKPKLAGHRETKESD